MSGSRGVMRQQAYAVACQDAHVGDGRSQIGGERMSKEPERVDLESPDLAAAKRAAFADLFPSVLADGVLDATRLGDLLDTEVTAPADGRERFGLMWAGKQD